MSLSENNNKQPTTHSNWDVYGSDLMIETPPSEQPEENQTSQFVTHPNSETKLTQPENVLGMKWFNFFKIGRPIITILLTLGTISEFAINYETYLSNPLYISLFIFTIVGVYLYIKLLFFNEDKKEKLFKLINVILIYDIINMIFNSIVTNLYSDAVVLFLSVAITFILGYFVWYKCNIKYFSKRLKSISKTNSTTESPKKNKKYCKHCGSIIDNVSKKCTGCGKQYFKGIRINGRTITFITILIVAICSIALNIKLYSDNYSLIQKINDLKQNNIEYIVSDNNDEYFEYWSENHNKVDFLDENIVFVIDGYGNYYYTFDQMQQVTTGLDTYSYWAYNKEAAIAKGYVDWK